MKEKVEECEKQGTQKYKAHFHSMRVHLSLSLCFFPSRSDLTPPPPYLLVGSDGEPESEAGVLEQVHLLDRQVH